MKCRTIEHWALREASGEIGPLRRRILARHCARCPNCAEFRSALPEWMQHAQSALDIRDAGLAAAARVVHNAPVLPFRQAIPAGIPAFHGLPFRVAAIAAALLLLLAAGGILATLHREPANVALQPNARTLGVSEIDLWELDADLLSESLAALTQDLRNAFQIEPEDLRKELDDLASELIRMEDSV